MAYTEQDRRNHIRELQQYLYSLSFLDETLPRVIPDGIYGRQTALAVRAFQQKNGLRPNGETNRATWDAIVNAYRQQIQRNTAASLYTRAGIVGGWRNRAASVGAAKHLENAGGSLYKYSESTDYRHL